MHKIIAIIFMFLCLLTLPVFASSIKELKLLTNPPESGKNSLEILLNNLDSNKHYTISVNLSMPAMGTMPEMKVDAEIVKKSKYVYLANYEIPMDGSWDMRIEIDNGTIHEILNYSLTTGINNLTDKNIKLNTKNKDVKKELSISNNNTHEILLSSDRIQKIGIRFATAKLINLIKNIRAIGVVEADSTKRSEIISRYPAYVKQYTNKKIGDNVKKGEVLATIESQELVAAQQEFLFAYDLKNSEHLNVASIYERLINLGLTHYQIDLLKKNKKVFYQIEIKANSSGTLLESNLKKGSRIEPGQVLFLIGDLKKNYIIAKIFQQNSMDVKQGQLVQISFPGQGTKSINGTVDLIYSNTNSGTGTTNIRIVSNSTNVYLQAGSYAEIKISVSLGERIVIPTEAILHTGVHTYVFVNKGNGVLNPIEVETGKYTEDYTEILEGIQTGDVVVASGNFLLSAEASLRNALPKWKINKEEESK